MSLDTILARLGAPKAGTVRCPSHDDSTASLSVSATAEGTVLMHCHAGCTNEAILSALGLPMSALYEPGKGKKQPSEDRAKLVRTYDYCNEDGDLLYQVCRFEPKDFRQRRPTDDGRWIWNLKDCRRVLYRLPQVLQAKEQGRAIWVCEGEKDVEALERAGEVATTNPMGAGKWHEDYTAFLAGAEVLVVADADEAGRHHAAQVAVALREAECRVSVFEPTAGMKDIAQQLGGGLGLEHLVLWPEERVTSRAIAPLLANYWVGDDYLDRDSEEAPPWAIPGLVRVNWKIVLVGVEGHGKSVLLRQLAICAAMGVHPLTAELIPTVRTMIVDLENDDEAISLSAKGIRYRTQRLLEGQGIEPPRGNWYIWIEEAGIDLRKPRDQRRLAERIELCRPQLVCIGPAYKMHPEGMDHDSDAVRQVVDLLDKLRVEYGFGLVIEHHAAKGSGKTRELIPFGSSLWMRWPGLGFKMKATRDGQPVDTMEPTEITLESFRGNRVVNRWPRRIHRSEVLGGWFRMSEQLAVPRRPRREGREDF